MNKCSKAFQGTNRNREVRNSLPLNGEKDVKKKIIFILLCLVSFNVSAWGDFDLNIGTWGLGNSLFFNYQPEYSPYNREYYQPFYNWNAPQQYGLYYPSQYGWNQAPPVIYYRHFGWNREPVIIFRHNGYHTYWKKNDEFHRRCEVKYYRQVFNQFTGRFTFEPFYRNRCNYEYRRR